MADAARKAAKKKRSTAQGTFHRYLTSFETSLKAGVEANALAKTMADIERAYSEVRGKACEFDGIV